jgi:hypothetical protein
VVEGNSMSKFESTDFLFFCLIEAALSIETESCGPCSPGLDGVEVEPPIILFRAIERV